MSFDKKEYMAAYREDNKNMISAYYKRDKERYDAYQAEYRERTMVCECGLLIKKYNYRKHQQSKVHCQLIGS